METKDTALDNCGEGQVIKKRCEILPNIWVSVFSQAFIIETINLSNLFTLVIASEDGNSAWVSNL